MAKRYETYANFEHFRILAFKDSLFRMDVRDGQTWILSNKELIWKKLAEDAGRAIQTVTAAR